MNAAKNIKKMFAIDFIVILRTNNQIIIITPENNPFFEAAAIIRIKPKSIIVDNINLRSLT